MWSRRIAFVCVIGLLIGMLVFGQAAHASSAQITLAPGDILSIVPADCTLFASPNGTELIVTCLSSGPIPTPTCAGPCQIVTTLTNTPGPTHTPAHTAQPTPSRPRPLPAVTIEARYLPPVTGR